MLFGTGSHDRCVSLSSACAITLLHIQMQFRGWFRMHTMRAVRDEGRARSPRALFRPGADDNNNRESDCCRVVGTLAIHPSLSLNTAQRVTTLITRGCCMLLGVLYLQQGRGVNPNMKSVSSARCTHSIADRRTYQYLTCRDRHLDILHATATHSLCCSKIASCLWLLTTENYKKGVDWIVLLRRSLFKYCQLGYPVIFVVPSRKIVFETELVHILVWSYFKLCFIVVKKCIPIFNCYRYFYHY
jgi:hypothetical protein